MRRIRGPTSSGESRNRLTFSIEARRRPPQMPATGDSLGVARDRRSSRGAPFEPGDEGSAIPADPSGPGQSKSLGMTAKTAGRHAACVSRQRVPTTGTDNGYGQRVRTTGTDNGYGQRVRTTGTDNGTDNRYGQPVRTTGSR